MTGGMLSEVLVTTRVTKFETLLQPLVTLTEYTPLSEARRLEKLRQLLLCPLSITPFLNHMKPKGGVPVLVVQRLIDPPRQTSTLPEQTISMKFS